MGKCVYVDNSNVWIEGKYHSAVSKGMVADVYEAHDNEIVDLKSLGAGGLSPSYADESIRMQEAEYAIGWYKNQMSDIFR